MSKEKQIIINLANELEMENRTLQKEINRLQKENEYLREREEYLEKRRSDIINTFQNKVTGTTIPKDKIRNKIKELKEIADNGANSVRFAMTYEDEIKRLERQKNISTMIEILEELLKE